MAARRKPDPAAQAARLPGTARTTRLRKLVCSDECGYIARVSRAAIDRGLPACPCGGILWPWDLEDVHRAARAGHLTSAQVAAHPLVQEWAQERASILHGQAGAAGAGRGGLRIANRQLQQPDALAALRVARNVRADAQRAKNPGPRAAADPIPF